MQHSPVVSLSQHPHPAPVDSDSHPEMPEQSHTEQQLVIQERKEEQETVILSPIPVSAEEEDAVPSSSAPAVPSKPSPPNQPAEDGSFLTPKS